MNDKQRPISERVAEMLGKTSYREIWQGGDGVFRPSLPDVAAQLGLIQQLRGDIVVQAMETFYGSTMMHERALRHAWEAHCAKVEPHLDYETCVLSRMGCALAVRQFAGVDFTSSELGEYAWIIRIRVESLKVAILLCEDWLDENMQLGRNDLREAFRAKAA